MRTLLGSLATVVIVLMGTLPETKAHDYDEVKEGRWRIATPQCEGYNAHLHQRAREQNREHRVDGFRITQFGGRVVATGLKNGSPRVTALGEVSEEYIHFQFLTSNTRGAYLEVWTIEILEDEDELDYAFWVTEHYADAVWVECDGIWYGGACSGNEYTTGVANFAQGWKRYSVKCTGTLEWTGY